MKTIDITSEEFRVYHYASGAEFRIESPTELHVLSDGESVSHRVVSADGKTYRPERGWVGISWKPKAGEPAFVA